jgi:hypothetical protein
MMRTLKTVACAAVLASSAMLVSGTASAAGTAVPKVAVELPSGSPLVVEVRDRHESKHLGKRYGHDHRRYHPGRRYDRPPAKWRRYSKRPPDWTRRGCVIVGPLWYCP